MKETTEKATPVKEVDCEKLKCKSLIIEGTKYRTIFTSKFENRKQFVPHNPKLIVSVIPGTVLKVHIKAGQKVTQGHELMVLEAMKMENLIKSPLNGKVKDVKVKPGDKVSKGFVMIELE
jgi:biotin carboxyl carrier protein